MKTLTISLGVTFLIVLSIVIFSHQGLLDLRKFQKQLADVRAVVAKVEDENKKLKSELDLVSQPSHTSMERKVREVLGWVKPGEVVYLEPSGVR